MANNYLQPVNNHFSFQDDKLEDIEDDIFLSNSRINSASNIPNGGRSNSLPYDDQRQIYLEKRRQIENRTLDSTHKSLGLLYETEEVGKATAAELAKQREQLEKTSHHLDEINASLRFSQKHLNGLKSVFGSLKNYLSGSRDAERASQAGSSKMASSPTNSQMSQNTVIPSTSNPNSNLDSYSLGNQTAKSSMGLPSDRYDNHPINRLRDDSSSSSSYRDDNVQMQQQKRSNPFEAQLEANLEEMCGNLSRLKFLATDLGSEIESQNDLLDNMNYKIEDVDLKLNKQNKEINKLLGKK